MEVLKTLSPHWARPPYSRHACLPSLPRLVPLYLLSPLHMSLPLITPEPFEEEDQEVVSPLTALAEVSEDRAESAQVHINTVTKQDEVTEQDTVISPIIEVSQPQDVSRELVTRPMVVVVNSQAELVTGTRANFSQTTPPITWSKIGRSRRGRRTFKGSIAGSITHITGYSFSTTFTQADPNT